MNKLLTLATGLAVSLGLTFGLCEIALRLAPTLIPPEILLHFEPTLRAELAAGRFTTHEDVRRLERDDGGPALWLYRPFAEKNYPYSEPGVVQKVRTDDMGFCNEPGSYDAGETIDLISIGDSFTFCHSVHAADTWTARLGELSGLSAYNLGRGGIGLYEEIQILERFGLPRKPAVVVLNVYEGNDLRDAYRHHEFRGGSAEDSGPGSYPWHATLLGRHSHVFNLAAAAVSRARARSSYSREKSGIDYRYRLVDGGAVVAFNEPNNDRDEIVFARRVRAGTVGFDVFDTALESFAALAREHGFAAVVAYTPCAYTAYRRFVTFEDPALAEVLDWFSGEQRAYFAQRSRELGLTFVDLTPHFQAAADGITLEELYYYPTSLHYTPRGHLLAADVLAETLRELGFQAD